MVGATTRSSEALRTLLRETSFDVGDLIYPVFVHHDPDHYEPIASMPGQYQWGVNHLPRLIDDLLQIPEHDTPCLIHCWDASIGWLNLHWS